MRNIETHYAQTPTEPLAHYTSASGLAGILSSRSMWATNIRFLNDAREFLHAVDLAKSHLLTVNARPTSASSALLASRLLGQLESMHGTTWIISFSERSDLLSQWRGYCPNGGYSIAFKVHALSQVAARHQLAFARCIYDRSQQEQMIRELVEAAFESFPSYLPPSQHESSADEEERAMYFASRWFFPKMLRLGSLMKDPAFTEEAEWRLVGGLYKPHVVPEYRIRGSIVVPHRVISLAVAASLNEVIDQILIGPGMDAQQADIGLFFLKQAADTGHIPHLVSKVPFRNQ